MAFLLPNTETEDLYTAQVSSSREAISTPPATADPQPRELSWPGKRELEEGSPCSPVLYRSFWQQQALSVRCFSFSPHIVPITR